jgi:hypothetical protein
MHADVRDVGAVQVPADVFKLAIEILDLGRKRRVSDVDRTVLAESDACGSLSGTSYWQRGISRLSGATSFE